MFVAVIPRFVNAFACCVEDRLWSLTSTRRRFPSAEEVDDAKLASSPSAAASSFSVFNVSGDESIAADTAVVAALSAYVFVAILNRRQLHPR